MPGGGLKRRLPAKSQDLSLSPPPLTRTEAVPATGGNPVEVPSGVSESSAAKVLGRVAKQHMMSKAPAGAVPTQTNGQPQPDENILVAVATRALMDAIRASHGNAKWQDMRMLAQSLSESLQIKHLYYFLNVLKRTINERAKKRRSTHTTW